MQHASCIHRVSHCIDIENYSLRISLFSEQHEDLSSPYPSTCPRPAPGRRYQARSPACSAQTQRRGSPRAGQPPRSPLAGHDRWRHGGPRRAAGRLAASPRGARDRGEPVAPWSGHEVAACRRFRSPASLPRRGPHPLQGADPERSSTSPAVRFASRIDRGVRCRHAPHNARTTSRQGPCGRSRDQKAQIAMTLAPRSSTTWIAHRAHQGARRATSGERDALTTDVIVTA
jgi:hypothetical protein